MDVLWEKERIRIAHSRWSSTDINLAIMERILASDELDALPITVLGRGEQMVCKDCSFSLLDTTKVFGYVLLASGNTTWEDNWDFFDVSS